jgi:hypothetical protein
MNNILYLTIFWHFHHFLGSAFHSHMGNGVWYLKLIQMCKVLKQFFVTKISSSAQRGQNIQLFLNCEQLRFMLAYDVAMLIMCLIINGSIEWKIYTHKKFELNTKSAQIFCPEYSYCWHESKIVTFTSYSIKPTFISNINYTRVIQHHTVCNAYVEMDGSAAGMCHHFPCHISVD